MSEEHKESSDAFVVGVAWELAAAMCSMILQRPLPEEPDRDDPGWIVWAQGVLIAVKDEVVRLRSHA